MKGKKVHAAASLMQAVRQAKDDDCSRQASIMKHGCMHLKHSRGRNDRCTQPAAEEKKRRCLLLFNANQMSSLKHYPLNFSR